MLRYFFFYFSLKLKIALFGNFVDEINSFIANSEVQQPIVVLQFGKIKTFKGNFRFTICN